MVWIRPRSTKSSVRVRARRYTNAASHVIRAASGCRRRSRGASTDTRRRQRSMSRGEARSNRSQGRSIRLISSSFPIHPACWQDSGGRDCRATSILVPARCLLHHPGQNHRRLPYPGAAKLPVVRASPTTVARKRQRGNVPRGRAAPMRAMRSIRLGRRRFNRQFAATDLQPLDYRHDFAAGFAGNVIAQPDGRHLRRRRPSPRGNQTARGFRRAGAPRCDR